MRKTANLFLIILFATLLFTGCRKEDNSNLPNRDIKESKTFEQNTSLHSDSKNASNENDNKKKELLQRLYDRWLYSEDDSWFMEINEKTITTGIPNSGCIKIDTYELTEVNIDMNYVIVNIKKVYEPEGAEADGAEVEEVNYFDKIILDKDKVTYMYKYNDETERHTSLWVKK